MLLLSFRHIFIISIEILLHIYIYFFLLVSSVSCFNVSHSNHSQTLDVSQQRFSKLG